MYDNGIDAVKNGAQWLRDHLFVPLLLLWIVFSYMFQEIDRQLGIMHLPGAASSSVGSLTKPFQFGAAPVRDALDGWAAWRAAFPGLSGPADLVRVYLLFDLVFPLLTAGLLVVWAHWAWKVSDPTDPADDAPATASVGQSLSALAGVAIAAYLVADCFENVALSTVLFAQVPGQGWLSLAMLTVVSVVLGAAGWGYLAHHAARAKTKADDQPGGASGLVLWLPRLWRAAQAAAVIVALSLAGVVVWLSRGGACSSAATDCPSAPSTFVLGAASSAKFVFLALAIVPLLVPSILRFNVWRKGGGLIRVVRSIVAVRATLLAVLVVAWLPVLGSSDLGLQVQDMLLRTNGTALGGLLLFVGVAALLALLAAFGEHCIAAQRARPGDLGLWWLAFPIGGVVALVAALVVAGLHWPGAAFLVVVGALVTVLSVLSLPKAIRNQEDDHALVGPDLAGAVGTETDAAESRVALTVLLTLVPLAFAIITARAAVVVWQATSSPNITLFLVTIGLLVLAYLVWRVPSFPGNLAGGQSNKVWRLAAPAVTVVVCLAAVALAVRPVATASAVGSVFVLLLESAVIAVLLTWTVLVANELRARGALAVLGFRRPPVLLLLVVALVILPRLDASSDYHAVNVETPGADTSVTPEQAFGDWRAAATASATGEATPSPTPAASGGATTAKRPVPMIFIATAGGGIKAAYWTDVVLTCMAHPGAKLLDPAKEPGGPSANCPTGLPVAPESVFVASGISGGSLGLAVDQAGIPTAEGSGNLQAATFLREMYNRDLVAPDLAGMFWRDAPNGIVRFDTWPDRARVLEDSWTQTYDAAITAATGGAPADGGLGADFLSGSFTAPTPGRDVPAPKFPLLVLNGGTIEDKCRLAVSPLRLGPTDRSRCLDGQPGDGRDRVVSRTKNITDFLCEPDKGVSRATAAHLSARFPFVSPYGQLTKCGDAEPSSFDVDGGVVESSGAGPLPDLFHDLAPLIATYNAEDHPTCIAPKLLLIDNGYLLPTAAGDVGLPSQLSAPNAFRTSDSAASPAAQQDALIAFEHEFGEGAKDAKDSTSATNDERCGDDGPRTARADLTLHPGFQAPLGWALSDQTRAEMSQQMSTAAGPRCALVAVRSWARQGQQTATPDPAGDACVEGTLSAVTGSTSSAGVVKELAVVTAGDRDELAHAFVVPGNTFAVPVAVTAPTPAEVCVVESASARDRRFAELDVSSGGGSEQFSRCRRIPDLQPDAVAQVPTDGLNDLVPPQGTS